jgi:hypothetical protein
MIIEARIAMHKEKQKSIGIYMMQKLIYTKGIELKRRGASRRLSLETWYFIGKT